jgi:stress-induced morphogen
VLRVKRHTSGTTPSSTPPTIAPTNHRLHRNRLVITSAAFASKPQLARHRAVNALLKEELEREGGIHALQLRTLTQEEEERLMKRAKELESQGEESK